MCGITGFINFSGHDQDKSRKLLKRMTDTLVHRGPDAEGFYVDDKAIRPSEFIRKSYEEIIDLLKDEECS